jgi:hypothetical protein
MNFKKMCASHNLILLVSLVTLALVIVLVVKQEREQFLGYDFGDRKPIHARQLEMRRRGDAFAGVSEAEMAKIQAAQDKRFAEKQVRRRGRAHGAP